MKLIFCLLLFVCYSKAQLSSYSDLEEFEIQNRIPPWALKQRTMWGVRFFFKRGMYKI